ncbi:MAG: transposase [Candidatus Omnitrophica bacterium]|nr:transposase [Candidatus Omnitrophota bacterium]MCK5493894.1 transposase [Candidatus Omnitrophota bacterium]
MRRIKEKLSEVSFKEFPEIKKRYWGQYFWAREYFVSSFGINDETIKKYIQNQRENIVENQMKFWK